MSRNRDYLDEVLRQSGWDGRSPDRGPDEDLPAPGWRWIGLYDFAGSDSVEPEAIEVIREELDRFEVYDRDALPRAYKIHNLHFDFLA